MPTFFFDLFEGVGYRDEEGQQLSDLPQAVAMALRYAREIAAEQVRTGHLHLDHFISVRDGTGAVVGEVTFKDAITLSG